VDAVAESNVNLLQGVVIKFNANQRYATTAITASIVRQIASKVQLPLQVDDDDDDDANANSTDTWQSVLWS